MAVYKPVALFINFHAVCLSQRHSIRKSSLDVVWPMGGTSLEETQAREKEEESGLEIDHGDSTQVQLFLLGASILAMSNSVYPAMA